MNLQVVEWGMGWINLVQDRARWRELVKGNELSGYIKCRELLD